MSLLEHLSTVVRSSHDDDRAMRSVRVDDLAPEALDEDRPMVVLVPRASSDSIEQLLLAVPTGGHDALVALEGRVGGLVRANIRRVLRDASRSDAATRQFFDEVLQDADDFDPDRDSAQGWLLTRAHQRAIDSLAHEAPLASAAASTPSTAAYTDR